MEWSDEGIVLALEPHGESAGILDALTRQLRAAHAHTFITELPDGVAPSYGDIFRTNSGKNGLLAIVLPEAEVDRLMESVDLDTGSEMTVDLERCVIVAPDGREVPFEFDEATRHRILGGLDDIAITLQREDAIAAYETAHGIA